MDVRQLITEDEGRRKTAYQDSRGIWTAGVGRCLERVPFSQDELALIKQNDASRIGQPWSEWSFSDDEIDLMLDNDITRAERGLRTMLPWFGGLDEVRQAGLIDMAFNLGVDGVAKFRKMLDHLKFGEWLMAANEALNSNWEIQVGKRALRIATMFKTGQWPT